MNYESTMQIVEAGLRKVASDLGKLPFKVERRTESDEPTNSPFLVKKVLMRESFPVPNHELNAFQEFLESHNLEILITGEFFVIEIY